MNLEFIMAFGGYLLGAGLGLYLLFRFSTSAFEGWSGTPRQKMWVLSVAEGLSFLIPLTLFWIIRDPKMPNLGMSWMLLWFFPMFALGGVLQLGIWKWVKNFLFWWTKPAIIHEPWPELEDDHGRPSPWEEVCRRRGIPVDQ